MCKSFLIPLLAGIALTFAPRTALGANEKVPVAQRPDGRAPLPDRITTLDGRSYEKVVVERVEPDGLLVRFAPAGGGLGAVKLKFRNLPAEWREEYRYDAAQAADYEGARARGEAVWRAENAAWVEQRREAQAEQAAWERRMRAESEARRAETELARAEATRYTQPESVSYYPWWGSGSCGFDYHQGGLRGGHIAGRSPDRSGRRFHGNLPHLQPGFGISQSHVSSQIGPMRPLGK